MTIFLPRRSFRFCVFVCACAWWSGVAAAQSLTLVETVQLPDVQVGSQPDKMHTQGLYVTNTDFLVTARLESLPKRGLLLRFSRADINDYTYLDLSPDDAADASLNHPGGIDRDADGVFWIPLSTSHPKGPTTVYGLSLRDRKLPEQVDDVEHAFRLDDHLGALACLPNGELLGANWDTKTIYRIDSADGTVSASIPQASFFGESADARVAVQDWKYDNKRNVLMAGGIDKSPDRPETVSRALVATINPIKQATIAILRLPPRDDVSRPLTNEGMAWWEGDLFLLPEDIGKGAKILRFSVQ